MSAFRMKFKGHSNTACTRALAAISEGGLMPRDTHIFRDEDGKIWTLEMKWDIKYGSLSESQEGEVVFLAEEHGLHQEDYKLA